MSSQTATCVIIVIIIIIIIISASTINDNSSFNSTTRMRWVLRVQPPPPPKICPDPLGELTALPQIPQLDHGGRESKGEMERQQRKGGEGKKAERERKGEGSGGGGRGKGWYSGMKILATALRNVNSIYQFQLNFSLVSFHFLVTGAQRLHEA